RPTRGRFRGWSPPCSGSRSHPPRITRPMPSRWPSATRGPLAPGRASLTSAAPASARRRPWAPRRGWLDEAELRRSLLSTAAGHHGEGSRPGAQNPRGMIAWVGGEVLVRGPDHVVIDAGGVGYRLSVSAETLKSVPARGKHASLHSQLVARDDALS